MDIFDLLKKQKQNLEDVTQAGGYVYIMQLWNTDIYKIGISKDPNRRLKQIQSRSPIPVNLIAYWWGNDYKVFEKYLHHSFDLRAKRIKGEWFRLKPKDFLDVMEVFPLGYFYDPNRFEEPGASEAYLRDRKN